MDIVTRRKFLAASGVVGAAALTAGAGAYTWDDIMATAGGGHGGHGDDSIGLSATAAPVGAARNLVLVTLYGGNDGLATVIPYADGKYQDLRGGLAYTAEQVLRLDGTTGLNPALTGLKALYDAKQLAIVRGVGYPKPDLSHFRSMDIWQTADPAKPATSGWLGRWLDEAGGDPRLAISLEPVLPPVLAGLKSAGAAVPIGGISVPGSIMRTDLTALAKAQAGEPALQARAAGCFNDLLSVDKLIKAAKKSARDNRSGATSTGGARSPLRSQLDVVAQCIEAGVATRVYSVSLGGFDFHAGEKGAQEVVLKLVDSAVSSFLTRMNTTARGRNTVIVVYSEFGRRVQGNDSGGTDHGTASDVLIGGAPVAGGRLLGEQPSLRDLDDGDLKYHIDFRDIYASVLAEVLHTDPGAVLSGWKTSLQGLFV
ncbi:DUF1501 domain-containing protein [Hamadaea tsunoensis]|uniref:DUF1501 domain-containing protein n=1 Tax=Hamadaea tsunoensis TaxID=53368 RepID=UPI000403E8A7|nr:DUF1501 domain-containing protein [Hamadaea tsunoensis]